MVDQMPEDEENSLMKQKIKSSTEQQEKCMTLNRSPRILVDVRVWVDVVDVGGDGGCCGVPIAWAADWCAWPW